MTVFGRGASAVFRDRELNVVGLKRKGVGDEGTLSVGDDPKASGRSPSEFLRDGRTDLRALLLKVLEKVFVRSDRFLARSMSPGRVGKRRSYKGKNSSSACRSPGRTGLSSLLARSAIQRSTAYCAGGRSTSTPSQTTPRASPRKTRTVEGKSVLCASSTARPKEASPVRRSSGNPVRSRTIGMSASITRASREEIDSPRASTISFSSGGG